MEKKLKLPIGIENFEKLRTEGFYYVDKTGLITELLENLQHGARYTVWKRDSRHTFAELSASGTRGTQWPEGEFLPWCPTGAAEIP